MYGNLGINTLFNCSIHISSFNAHKNPYKWGIIIPHFRDEETKADSLL